MEQLKYLIDTNAIIDFLAKNLPEAGMLFISSIIDETPNVSVITKIEVLGYNTSSEYYLILEDFINDCNVFHLNDEIVEICISLRKNNKIKLPDAIIASTAIANGFTIISRNIKDFQNIKNLNCINPYIE